MAKVDKTIAASSGARDLLRQSAAQKNFFKSVFACEASVLFADLM
jgi:hypothetical protein